MKEFSGEKRTEALRLMAYELITEWKKRNGENITKLALDSGMFLLYQRLKENQQLDVHLPYWWGKYGVEVDWEQIPGVEFTMKAVGAGGIVDDRIKM